MTTDLCRVLVARHKFVESLMHNIIDLFQSFSDKLTFVRPASVLAAPLSLRLERNLDETRKWIVSSDEFAKNHNHFLLHDFGTHHLLAYEDLGSRKLHYGFTRIGDDLCVPFKILHTGKIGYAPIALKNSAHELSALVQALEAYDTQPLFIHMVENPHMNNDFADPSENGIVPAIGSVGCSAFQVKGFEAHDRKVMQWAQTFCNTYPVLHPERNFGDSTFIASGRRLNAKNTREIFIAYYFCTNGHVHTLDSWLTKCLTHISDVHSTTGYEGVNERTVSPHPWVSLVSDPKPMTRHTALKNIQFLLEQLPPELQAEGQTKLFETTT